MLAKPSQGFEKFIRIVSSPWFFICWLLLYILSYFFLDKKIAFFFKPHDTILFTWSDSITRLGYPAIYICFFALLALLGWIFCQKTKVMQYALFVLSALIATAIVQNILKIILGKARPVMLFNEDVYGFYFMQRINEFWSLPSGLITTFTALLTALCFIVPRYWSGIIIVLVVISFTRLVVTVHYLSDMLATLYIAMIIVIWTAKFFRKQHWIV